MNLIDVQPKDIFILVEMSLKELKLLEMALRNATIDHNEKEPETEKAAEFLTTKFYPDVVKILGEMKDGLDT